MEDHHKRTPSLDSRHVQKAKVKFSVNTKSSVRPPEVKQVDLHLPGEGLGLHGSRLALHEIKNVKCWRKKAVLASALSTAKSLKTSLIFA